MMYAAKERSKCLAKLDAPWNASTANQKGDCMVQFVVIQSNPVRKDSAGENSEYATGAGSGEPTMAGGWPA